MEGGRPASSSRGLQKGGGALGWGQWGLGEGGCGGEGLRGLRGTGPWGMGGSGAASAGGCGDGGAAGRAAPRWRWRCSRRPLAASPLLPTTRGRRFRPTPFLALRPQCVRSPALCPAPSPCPHPSSFLWPQLFPTPFPCPHILCPQTHPCPQRRSRAPHLPVSPHPALWGRADPMPSICGAAVEEHRTHLCPTFHAVALESRCRAACRTGCRASR